MSDGIRTAADGDLFTVWVRDLEGGRQFHSMVTDQGAAVRLVALIEDTLGQRAFYSEDCIQYSTGPVRMHEWARRGAMVEAFGEIHRN